MSDPSSSSLGNTNGNTNGMTASDALEERMIDAEYKIWKKNTPYLYDLVMTHALEWPSLTCQWLPNTKDGSSTATKEHSLLLGTHTTGEPNHLLVCTVHLPAHNQNPLVDNSSSSKAGDETMVHTLPASHYDEEKGEVGGFGFHHQATPHLDGVVEVKMKLLHEGEVHRARYCPQDPFVIATKGPASYVYIYDLSKHSSIPTTLPSNNAIATPKPNLVLGGHSKEGYGLAWSNHNQGHLISGSLDCTVCYWDIQHALSTSSSSSSSTTDTSLIMDPLCTFTGHTGPVEDVDWHKLDPYLIGSCGDDATVRLWDTRAATTTSTSDTSQRVVTQEAHAIHKAHDGDVHCLAFHPTNEFLLATGSADRSVVLWDMRNLKSYVIQCIEEGF
jgi:histone-binding protein RBBP4